jgi:uncharacterized protein YjbI with pentapeptide repeats
MYILIYELKIKTMKKREIKSNYGSILFEYEKENNTLKKTVKEAVKKGADLQGADFLQGAYLRDAYFLQGAYLQGVYLTGGIKIKKAAVFTGLYKYVTIPYITETDEKRIKLGCYDRLLSEWNENFWNNSDEFTDYDSMESKLRIFAFNTAKEWLELNKN